MNTTFPVTPIHGPVHLELEVPGSKSITNRALLLAALADGVTEIRNTLFSDDSRHFLDCLKDLGFPVVQKEEEKKVIVTGFGGSIPQKKARIYVGSAGTAARFLTALLGLSDGIYYLDSSEQMKKRPIKPLLSVLEKMGACITYHEQEGYFPFTIQGASLHKKKFSSIQVDITSSSQFLSALLMTAPVLKDGLTIELTGQTHALSYVKITTAMMKQFGVAVQNPSSDVYQIPALSSYQSQIYHVEPDISAACYFYAIAPLIGGSILVKQVHLNAMQGDIQFLRLLEQMGCSLTDFPAGVCIEAPVNFSYSGLTVDMGAYSDQTMTLAALASFASSTTIIKNISHIRFQECDRIYAIQTELNRMGVPCTATDSNLYIEPSFPNPAEIETYHDHRMAMAFALIGLKIPGIIIKNPACCRKTFEDYFSILESIITSYS